MEGTDPLGMLKEPRQSDDGLSSSNGRHFSISKLVKFRRPRKNPHKTMKKAGKEMGKMMKGVGKFMHEVYEEG